MVVIKGKQKAADSKQTNKNVLYAVCDCKYFTQYLPDADAKILHQLKKKLHKLMKEKSDKGYLLLSKYKDTAFAKGSFLFAYCRRLREH